MTALEPGKVVMSSAYVRVTEFLDEHESWAGAGSHIRTTGEYGTTRHTLNSHMLRTLLRDQRLLAEQLEAERRKVADLKTELEQGRKGVWRP